MKTHEIVYKKIQDLWEDAVAPATSALVFWTLFQICCMTLGDVAVHLAVVNSPWQRDLADNCVQHITYCQSVRFDQQYLIPKPVTRV